MISLSIFLSYLSPTTGFLGTVLLFFFGIPKRIDTGGKSMIVATPSNEEVKIEKDKTRKYNFWGNFGLGLIALSYILSLPCIPDIIKKLLSI